MDEENYLLNILNYDGGLEKIGSATDARIKYPSDVDLQERIITDEPKPEIFRRLRRIIGELRKNDDFYLTDIKMGVWGPNNPVKWTFDEFYNKKEKEYAPGRKITPISALEQKSIIKFDVVLRDSNDIFHEYSVNYYFTFLDGPQTTFYNYTKKQFQDQYIIEIGRLEKEKKYWKALKRMYSMYKFLGGHEKEKKALLKIFNSDLGYNAMQISRLDMLKNLVLNKAGYRRPKKQYIIKNLELIQDSLPFEFYNFFDSILDYVNPAQRFNYKELDKEIGEIYKNLMEMINFESFEKLDEIYKLN